MRQIILFMVATLDGRIAGRGGDLGWMVSPDEGREADALALLDRVDTALLGHGVYREMVRFWPTERGEFADRINAMPKVVLSRSRETLTWNNATQLLTDDEGLADAVEALKRQPGSDIVLYGGAQIVQSLARLGLIDEFQLAVHPVGLGDGTPLFEDGVALELLGVTPYASGVVLMRYRPARAV